MFRWVYPAPTQVSVWMKPDALPPQRLGRITLLQCPVKRIRTHTGLHRPPKTTAEWRPRKTSGEPLAPSLKNCSDVQVALLQTAEWFTVLLASGNLSQRKHTYECQALKCKREADSQCKSRLTSVLNTPLCYCGAALSCSYRGERGGRWTASGLETPSGMQIGMGGMSVTLQPRLWMAFALTCNLHKPSALVFLKVLETE